jgi:threonine dehydratase
MATEITIEDIRAAADRIAPYIHRTPVMRSASLDRAAGTSCFLKCENLQRGGAFKIRGAANFVFSIPESDIGRGVVAFSSGNHAQAVAIAAGLRGTTATLVMPTDAPKAKLEATRDRGGKIVAYDRVRESREAIGARIAAETGATLVPPFDHPWTITGQGTLALELLEDVADLDALVVCLGGGGMLSGCATAAKAVNPGIRIFGVEPEIANDWYLSLEAGRIVEIPPPATIADGLRSPAPGKITFPIVQKLAEKVVLVSEKEIAEAAKFLFNRLKLVVEPSGAVATAAALFGKLPPGLKRVGIVVSGGNVDLETLSAL